jgi:hypothetical protein
MGQDLVWGPAGMFAESDRSTNADRPLTVELASFSDRTTMGQ